MVVVVCSWCCSFLLLGFVVLTGEEDEETICQARGKLFILNAQSQWKERGTGMLKLNVRRDDGSGARLGEALSSFLYLPLVDL